MKVILSELEEMPKSFQNPYDEFSELQRKFLCGKIFGLVNLLRNVGGKEIYRHRFSEIFIVLFVKNACYFVT